MGHTYIKKLLIIYLNFTFNWAAYIIMIIIFAKSHSFPSLSNPTPSPQYLKQQQCGAGGENWLFCCQSE